MIPTKGNEPRRSRVSKLNKHLDELYRKGKCREFAVVVTRMDFAKILGKFTKVKIQYESSSPTKTRGSSAKSGQSNSRLKSNENGMVMIHRHAYNKHPANNISSSPKRKYAEKSYPARSPSNILKENNRQKKPLQTTDKNANYNEGILNVKLKRYGIIFNIPNIKENNQIKCDSSLAQLFPAINKNILPSEEWCIDYFPKDEEPKEDKVYDRIKAELEGLMCLDKNMKSPNKIDSIVNPTSDFPSIMDILNDDTGNSTAKAESNNIESKTSLESCDVEAMLLGKEDSEKLALDLDESPKSPTILDEALQKGIEEHLIGLSNAPLESSTISNPDSKQPETYKNEPEKDKQSDNSGLKAETVTHVIFKKIVDGNCAKSVTCPKNMNYTIELEGKKVEFIGAPKFVSSVEDLQVLLQIVNDTDLNNLYVLH